MSNLVVTKFAGEDHAFGFNLNEIEELQRLCKTGLGTVVDRVMENQFYFEDIWHTIRLGLIGSGECSSVRAVELCNLTMINKPLASPGDPSSPLAVAKVILGSIMFGMAEPTEPKKDQAEDDLTDGSMSPQYELPLSKQAATQ